MTLRSRSVPFIALAALIFIVTWPIFQYGTPSVDDGPNHFYRLVELDWHVRHGDLYPRWFADLHYGFGAPLLNFYAPLSYYIALAPHLLGFSFSASFAISYVLAVAVAVVGMYIWARDQFDSPIAGLVAASAYALAPHTFVNLLVRAAHPETWALAFAPWTFWSALRLMRQPSRVSHVAFTLVYAALILTHNLSALLITPVLMTYALALYFSESPHPPSKNLFALGAGILHALALAALFLLPFVLEAQYVQLSRASLNFQEFFITPGILFSPPIPFDPKLVTNRYPVSLPWPQLALLAVGCWQWVVRRRDSSFIANCSLFIVHCSLFILLSLFTLPITEPLWNIIPFARLIQFPWRLMGPATLLLAWLCASVSAHLPGTKYRLPVSLVAISAFFFFSLTWTFHQPYEPFPAAPQPVDAIQYEIDNPGHAGTTSNREFLPRWVRELPPPVAMLARYENNPFPSRLAELPPGVTLAGERNALNAVDLEYESASDFTLTFNLFYFPGWTAVLDRQSAQIYITGPHGLISLNLPPGRHMLRLFLQPTVPQITGVAISLIALVALFIPLLRRSAARLQTKDLARAAAPLSPVFAFLLVGLLGFRILSDHIQTPFNRTQLGHIPNGLAVNFGDQLALIGFDLPRGATFTSGGPLPVNLYWQAVTSLNTEYHTTVQLVDKYGNRFGQSDNQHPGSIPTTRWRTDQYARDEHQLPSLSGTPPGPYHLLVSVYANAPLNILNADGTPAGIEYDLGPVTVTRARPQPAGRLRLIDSSIGLDTVSVGDRLPFTILWSSGNEPTDGLAANVKFTDANGQPIFAATFPPAGPDYPSEQWTPRELIRYPHSVDLPPDLPAGPVHLTLTFIHPDGSPASQSFELGAVTITVPERSFAIPPMSHRVDHDFNDAIRLLGYDITPDRITLYWQSLQPVSTRLTVFMHNFDASGNFIGGQDSPPPRPTTSWLPGEVITDIHQIAIGDDFEIGFYDPVTGERFGEPFSNQP